MCILINVHGANKYDKGIDNSLMNGSRNASFSFLILIYFFVSRHLKNSCLVFAINIWSASGKRVFRNDINFERASIVLFCTFRSLQSS